MEDFIEDYIQSCTSEIIGNMKSNYLKNVLFKKCGVLFIGDDNAVIFYSGINVHRGGSYTRRLRVRRPNGRKA